MCWNPKVLQLTLRRKEMHTNGMVVGLFLARSVGFSIDFSWASKKRFHICNISLILPDTLMQKNRILIVIKITKSYSLGIIFNNCFFHRDAHKALDWWVFSSTFGSNQWYFLGHSIWSIAYRLEDNNSISTILLENLMILCS